MGKHLKEIPMLGSSSSSSQSLKSTGRLSGSIHFSIALNVDNSDSISSVHNTEGPVDLRTLL